MRPFPRVNLQARPASTSEIEVKERLQKALILNTRADHETALVPRSNVQAELAQVSGEGSLRGGRNGKAQTESSKRRIDGGTIHRVDVNPVGPEPCLAPP